MEFVVKEILFFTYVWFLGFSILILFGPYQSNSTKVIASRLWTPPTRPEHLYRPDTGRPDTGQSAASVQSWTLR